MSEHVELSKKEMELNANRHGLISVILLIVGCLGGITVWAGAIESVVSLTLVVLPTMTTLSLLLAVAPMQWILRMSYISISLDVILLIYYLLIA